MPQKKILMFFPRGVGDAVFASGVLARLVNDERDAEFHLVFLQKSAACLFEGVPRLRALHIVPYSYSKTHWPALLRIGWGHHWYRVVDGRRTIISYLVRTRYRHPFILDKSLHKVEQHARVMGYEPTPQPKLWLSQERLKQGLNLLPSNVPVIAVSPKSSRPIKDWALENFITTIKNLRRQNKTTQHAKIALHGMLSDYIQKIFHNAFGDDLLNLADQPLDVVAGTFLRTRLLIGNDSGLAHVAAAMGAPVLALFGPTSEANFFPYGPYSSTIRGSLPHDVLITRKDKYPRSSAMGDLSVPNVVKACEALLEKSEAWQCA